MTVQSIMTHQPLSAKPDETLGQAARRMWDGDCGALPVLDATSGRVVGVITDRDICMATWSRGMAPDSIRVCDAMSDSIVTCQPADSIGTAEASMRSHQLRRLPVVDEQDQLVGIISLADIALAHASTKRHPSPNDGVAATLAVICNAGSTSMAGAAAS